MYVNLQLFSYTYSLQMISETVHSGVFRPMRLETFNKS